jgi:hypothetical protein
MTEDDLSDLISGRKSIEVSRVIHDMVFTKYRAWEYEREWRIFAGDGRFPQQPFEDSKFAVPELGAVIFGCRSAAEDRRRIHAVIAERFPLTKLYEARKADRAYELTIVPYTG